MCVASFKAPTGRMLTRQLARCSYTHPHPPSHQPTRRHAESPTRPQRSRSRPTNLADRSDPWLDRAAAGTAVTPAATDPWLDFAAAGAAVTPAATDLLGGIADSAEEGGTTDQSLQV